MVIRQFSRGTKMPKNKHVTLNYEPDIRRLIELFGQHEEPEVTTGSICCGFSSGNKQKTKIKPTNMKEGTNLTNGTGTNSFYRFMQDVEQEVDKRQPSYIMFFLMSHGWQNGLFYLVPSREDLAITECCCDIDAEHEQNCCRRHIVHDVISKIYKSYPDIPKLFIIQTCRGGEDAAVLAGEADPTISSPQQTNGLKNNDTELFIPSFTNTLVLHACIDKHSAFVLGENKHTDLKEGGSLLIQNFCKSFEEIKAAKRKKTKMLRKMKAKDGGVGQEICVEDMIDGWIMNACQRTSALVTNYLFLNVILPKTLQEVLLTRTYSDEDKTKFFDRLTKQEHYSEDPENVRAIKRACEYKDYWKHILEYLRYNVSYPIPMYELTISDKKMATKAKLQKNLNKLLEEIRAPFEPLKALLHRDEESANSTERDLCDELEKCLNKYRLVTDEDQTLLDQIIDESQDNGIAILRYLQANFKGTSTKQKLEFEHLTMEQSAQDLKPELKHKLNKIITEMQQKESFSKQQPHTSSTLHRFLSCIEIMKSQVKTIAS